MSCAIFSVISVPLSRSAWSAWIEMPYVYKIVFDGNVALRMERVD